MFADELQTARTESGRRYGNEIRKDVIGSQRGTKSSRDRAEKQRGEVKTDERILMLDIPDLE